MEFGLDKCAVIHLKKGKIVNSPIIENFPILMENDSYKYLGITINNTLTWNDHIDAVISKANRTLRFIWQMAGGTSTPALASLYKSLVLPVIEYGLPAWTPYTQTAISKIEKIHRRASRICLRQRRGEMEYKDRLHTLGWTSLESRRQKDTITFVVKCLFGLVDCQSVGVAAHCANAHPPTGSR